jgi:Arc/MetJ-type ribon-helix-helix transcriptional regulator
VDDNFAREMDEAMSPYYSTKTEFIREAIREKIKNIKKESTLDELKEYFGKAKTKSTLADDRRIRKQVMKEFAKKHGLKLD